MSDDDTAHPIVCDTGTWATRAGWAGDDTARARFLTKIVGQLELDQAKLQKPSWMPTRPWYTMEDEHYHERVAKGHITECASGGSGSFRPSVQGRNPIEYGMVTDWDVMEQVWHYMYSHELRAESESHRVLLIENPSNPHYSREKAAQILFEHFNIPEFVLVTSAELRMMASGQMTGLVAESGHGGTHITPVYEGCPLRHAILRSDVISGSQVTEVMLQHLNRQPAFSNLGAGMKLEVARAAKETQCKVALDFHEELESYRGQDKEGGIGSSQLELPDGNTLEHYYAHDMHVPNQEKQLVVSGNTKLSCSEALFCPERFSGIQGSGLSQLIFESINRCDIDIRRDMMQNVALGGGNTIFPGIKARVQQDLYSLVPSGCRVNVIAPPERDESSWIGGSIWASLSSTRDHWISSSEYNEVGPSIVRQRCWK